MEHKIDTEKYALPDFKGDAGLYIPVRDMMDAMLKKKQHNRFDCLLEGRYASLPLADKKNILVFFHVSILLQNAAGGLDSVITYADLCSRLDIDTGEAIKCLSDFRFISDTTCPHCTEKISLEYCGLVNPEVCEPVQCSSCGHICGTYMYAACNCNDCIKHFRAVSPIPQNLKKIARDLSVRLARNLALENEQLRPGSQKSFPLNDLIIDTYRKGGSIKDLLAKHSAYKQTKVPTAESLEDAVLSLIPVSIKVETGYGKSVILALTTLASLHIENIEIEATRWWPGKSIMDYNLEFVIAPHQNIFKEKNVLTSSLITEMKPYRLIFNSRDCDFLYTDHSIEADRLISNSLILEEEFSF